MRTPETESEFRIVARWAALLYVLLALATSCTIMLKPQHWDNTYGPVIPHDTFPADCSLCHVTGDWHQLKKDFVFDHEKETGVALHGAHAKAACLLCHNDRGPVAQFAARGCGGCHEDHHRGALGARCEDCHNEENWKPRDEIVQHDKTRFPLVGAHAAVECFRCHEGAEAGRFEGLDVACESCHLDDLERTASPDHRAVGWTQDCRKCHDETDFKNAKFEHPGSFPLQGGHSAVTCVSCHRGGSFVVLSTDCFTCHIDEYERTADPNHRLVGFGTDCNDCHQPTVWNTALFRHPPAFPLRGGHAGLDCAACHVSGRPDGVTTDCTACHLDEYEDAADPDHVAGGFPRDCAQCHNTNSWEDATFRHPSTFPLTNGHSRLDCTQCHVGGIGPLATACASCHEDDYQGATEPNHVSNGFSTDCTQCHTTIAWEQSTFVHPQTFPLVSGHANLDCAQCHEGTLGDLPVDCASCHIEDYQQAAEPNHVAAGFPEDCTQCHNIVSWRQSTFVHPSTFPLVAGHAGRDCAQCHEGSLGDLPTDCASCHMDDYQATTDPDHVETGLSTDCTQCHNTASWTQTTFAHPDTFPLSAGHGGLACTACHQGGVVDLDTECVACHQDDYQAATEPNHVAAGFPTDCTQCHNTTTWTDALFAHPPTFPLAGGHSGLDCAQCHVGSLGDLPTNCDSCHLEDYQQTTDPNHAAAGFPTDCTQCHNTTAWSETTFAHPTTFPLSGGHGGLDCAQCHVGSLGDLPTNCDSCHLDDYQQTTDPNHVAAGFPTDCTQCHDTNSWLGAVFSHPITFPLTGGHGGLQCAQCHVGGIGDLPTDCVSCHLQDYQQTTDPNHVAAGFPTDCTQCHNTIAWEDTTFSHPSTFPLTLGHGGLDCAQCHVGGLGPLPTDCASCHLDDYQQTTDPNHVAAEFSTDCTQCHTTASWEGATFEHPPTFPLTGGHGGLQCAQCHIGGIGPLPTDCVSCHLADYQGTTDPNHIAAGYPTDCTQCHTTVSWEGGVFEHPTSFPLTAGHSGLQCAQCHIGGIGPLPTDCISCHLDTYQQASDPNHVAAGFPTDCTQCHTTATWDSSTFTHPGTFPLTLGHGGLDCSLCHQGGLGPLPTDCANCHLDDYQQATDPNHAAAGFPTDCTQCHNTTTWQSSTFTHPVSFPLAGGHADVDCAQCHVGGLGPLPTDCASCHLDDYQQAPDPNHAAAGFPTDCTQCHTVTTWQSSTFTHPAGFPLTGGHGDLDCAQCHQGGLGPLPTDCVTCHLDDYQQTSDPSHVTAGFPTDCTQCHNTTTWEGATFEHPPSFPLTAGHGGLQCAACHQGVIGPLPTDCVSCHLDDYQQATVPNHAAAGFPTDCTQCHTTTTWDSSTFIHPAGFPLTGGHGSLDCAQCHQGGLGPLPTDCVTCHLDDYQQTTDPNHVAAGFPTDCTQCHNTTTWEDATFIHPPSFPLTAGHSGVDCAACHQGGIGPLPTNCDSCHLDDYQSASDPNHVAAGFPTDCTQCHNTTTWQSSTFTHPAGFPLTGGHGALDCAQCHQGILGPLPTNCDNCHLDDYQSASDPNHVAAGFPTDCTQCHNTTTWEDATFIHPPSFPLTAGHADVDCAQCHQGVIGPLPTNCDSCHLDDYQTASDPNHVAAGFPTDCTQCHTTTTWQGSTFVHSAGFPLTGGHGGVDCAQCHQGSLSPLPTNCDSCHLDDYQTATDPNHVLAGFPTDCTQCHTVTTWESSTFIHPPSFPLSAGHGGLDCAQCHQGSLGPLPTSCESCHLDDYMGTTDPNHAVNGFSTDCTACHNLISWQGGTFSHPFPTNSGPHHELRCNECHTTPGSQSAFSCIHCHEHNQADMFEDHDEVTGYVWASPDCFRCHPQANR